MNTWYEVKNETEIEAFLDMFWGLHDFRITDISFDPKTQQCEIKLEYDTRNLRLRLIFEDVMRMHITPNYDYECSWLNGAYMRIEDDGLVWINDDIDIQENELPEDATWIKSKKMLYAVTNNKYKPIPFEKWSEIRECGGIKPIDILPEEK